MLMTMPTQPTETRSKFRYNIECLSPNPGAEMLRYGWRRPDILSLGQGESSFTTPDHIIDAATNAMKDGRTFYAPVLGFPEVRQEISNYYSRIYNLQIPTNRLFLTGSGTTAMHLALTSILEEGDEVVAITPIWKNLLGAIELAEAKTVQVALESKNGVWQLDLDKLFDSVTARTKVLLIVTPSNPTGWVMSHEEIKVVLEFARARDLWIVSDEVYGRIVYDGVHAPSFLEHAHDEDKLYVVNSFSKAYAMTGWRLGWLVGPAYAESVIRDIALYDNMGPPSFVQLAGAEALRHGDAFLQQQIELWRKNRQTVIDFFAQYDDVDLPNPEATFYGFFHHPKEPDCIAFGRRLIDDVALSLAPGCSFGACSKGYTRLCFAVSETRLADALERLSRAL